MSLKNFMDLPDPVGERCRPRLQDFRRLDLMQFTIAHGGYRIPTLPRGDALGPELLAAPRADDHVGISPDDLAGIGDGAPGGARRAGQLRKHVLAARDLDELAHPADAADHRLVPLLEIDLRPAFEAFRLFLYL